MATFNDLYIAVRAADIGAVRRLVRSGLDINCRDSLRRTVLHHAAERSLGKIRQIIQDLVGLGADINARDMQGRTPLHYAMSDQATLFIYLRIPQERNISRFLSNLSYEERVSEFDQFSENVQITSVEGLLELGADVNARYDEEVTSLHRAMRLKSTRALEILVRLGMRVNARKLLNYTALHLALSRDRIALVEYLGEAGADVNLAYQIVFPIHLAIQQGRLDVLKILVENGADVNAFRIDNVTAIFLALGKKSHKLIESLVCHGADINVKKLVMPAIFDTVTVGRKDMLEYLAGHGASLSEQPLTSPTQLGLYAISNDYEMVEFLLKHGADPNTRFNMYTPLLIFAMRSGNTEIVKALLVKLGRNYVNERYLYENITALFCATTEGIEPDNSDAVDARTLQILLKYGADVNLRYDHAITPIFEAVGGGDKTMVRLLNEFGADLNCTKIEGMGVLDKVLMEPKSDDNFAKIKALVDAGVDLNVGHNDKVSVVHEAVRLGDSAMVRLLGELKVDMNGRKHEGSKPLIKASGLGRIDVIKYLAQMGADMNVHCSINVRPLHCAVRLGDIVMINCLIKSGASPLLVKETRITPLNLAVNIGENDIVRCLIECGADVNLKSTRDVSVLHDAIQYSHMQKDQGLWMKLIKDLTISLGTVHAFGSIDQVSLLDDSILHNHIDVTETLLQHGADKNTLQNTFISEVSYAINQDKLEIALLLRLLDQGVTPDNVGTSPLHTACELGHIDQARMLILHGNDVNKRDMKGKKPLEYLPLAKTVNYCIMNEAGNNLNATEKVDSGTISTVGCEDMVSVLQTPGIGNVHCIRDPSPGEISERMMKLLQIIPKHCRQFSKGLLIGIGSAAEGTKVGLPDEMDFMFKLTIGEGEEKKIKDKGDGYVQYDKPDCWYGMGHFTTGSAAFHNDFVQDTRNVLTYLKIENPLDKLHIESQEAPQIRTKDRKACTPLVIKWDDGQATFHISVDIVPSLHIENWPEGGVSETWLMKKEELRERGYVLVPKPPHTQSDLAKKYTEDDLQALWKISFPHLETEHMQRLEQRVKDVYLTAKCLRNPDVCRIMITDDGSLPKNVDKYVTSYLLKMIFFKNVEYFLQADLSLGEMVCIVYNELEKHLSDGFVPLFFLPNVSALSGIKLDVPKAAKVAKIMARFVTSLYLRDWVDDAGIPIDDDETTWTIYQRKPSSVYRIYDITS